MKTKLGTYLGNYVICPNSKDITVECYGTVYPSQRQTLEQEGFNSHVEIETVIHDGTEITDYLWDWILDDLTERCQLLNNEL